MTLLKLTEILTGLILSIIMLSNAFALPEKCIVGELYFNPVTKQMYICCPPAEDNFGRNIEVFCDDINGTKTEKVKP